MTDEELYETLGLSEVDLQKEAEAKRNAVIGQAAVLFEKETGRKADLFSAEFQPYILRVQNG